VNLAGKTSRWGGAVTSVLGWLVLLVGLSIALGVGLLLYALATVGVALAVALPVALVASGLGVPLVLGGKALGRSGALVERATREQAALSLASLQGPVTASEAARALGVTPEEADSILTGLAKREPERVAMDIDDQGVVRYRVVPPAGTQGSAWVPPVPPTRVTVDAPLRVPAEDKQELPEETGVDVQEGSDRAGSSGGRRS
jgi:hypothetical protein